MMFQYDVPRLVWKILKGSMRYGLIKMSLYKLEQRGRMNVIGECTG
jgi:hypothetical protein